MELLIVIIDCSAVIAKITSRTPAYDRVAQAETYGAIRRAERDEAFTDTEIQTETRIYQARWQALGDAVEERIADWREETRDARGAGWAAAGRHRTTGRARPAGGQRAGPEPPGAGSSEPPPSGAHDAGGGAGQQRTPPHLAAPRNRS